MPTARATSPIVIAYDGSAHAVEAVEQTARLFPERPVRVLTAWTSVRQMARAGRAALPRDVIAQAVQNLDAETEQHAAEIAAAGAELAREAGLDAEGLTVGARSTAAASVMADAEEHDAAAIVVGSRGQSTVRSLLLGSVSGAIVHHAVCPVLVVHLPPTQPDGDDLVEVERSSTG